jgi:hypothetical protein
MGVDEPASPWIRAGPTLGGVQAPAQWIVSGHEWCEARSYLAAELLNLAEGYGPLSEVQRTMLVPVELEFASRARAIKSAAARSGIICHPVTGNQVSALSKPPYSSV